jgi:hypothetical protein
MPQKFLLLAVLLLLTGFVAAQTPTPTESPEDPAKLELQAVEFLRETSVEVSHLRTLENRISFDSELASLMWFHDEKEARGMYSQVITDFKQLLTQFDTEMNAGTLASDDDDAGPGIFFGQSSSVRRKFRIAMAVRQQIATSLAEHAPDLAYNFFIDSGSQVSNPELRKDVERSDRNFESTLLQQIAESDPDKGLSYGKYSLKRGITPMHVEILRKLYAKDADKGIDFGKSLLSAVSGDPKKVDNLDFYTSLLKFGDDNLAASKKAGGKAPVYQRSDLRDIAELFYQAIMADSHVPSYEIDSYISAVEKYAPSRGAQLRTKFKVDSMPNGSTMAMNIASNAILPPAPAPARSNTNTTETPYERERREREAEAKAYEKQIDDVKKLGSSNLPKAERDAVIAQARKKIAATKGKDKKLAALTLLAAQVKKAGDTDLAAEIMRDAEHLVNPTPTNYQDYLFTWMLASGYAETDPDKAFPLLESTINRANETIAAFVKVAEFIDVQKELIDDGEVQVGMFGGEMIRGMTRELGLGSGTIKTLVNADFAKTRDLTNAFDRTETRVLAKMMVLRVILDKSSTAKPKDTDTKLITDVGD